MTETGRDFCADDAVEALLGKAAPRPVPPAAETEAARAAVKAQWRAMTNRRQRRQRLMSFAIAASVLIATFVSLNMLRTNGIEQIAVASIDKRFGSIYVLGENAELVAGNNLTTVVAGQTLITDAQSGIGLAWADGGSLRVDENTRVEFLSPESINLRSGRVYFDSSPNPIAAGRAAGRDARLTIMTDRGRVSHVGTQYMAHLNAGTLTVSVREGEVIVANAAHKRSASRGQQLAIGGGGAPTVLNVSTYGDGWQWIEQISPAVDLDGRSVDEFLGWVSHETGLTLEYASQRAAAYARREVLNGTLNTGPSRALEIWMMGSDLEWRIEDGVIYVDISD
jgi:ferric-dicitrate binding protein FerR (iron transport regulator)